METAKKLKMEKVYEANQGTGFVLIFNKDKPDEYEKLKGSTTLSEYEALFKKFN